MKRLLVVSAEAFSMSSSNGRTLMNMLQAYDKECLAQFYSHGCIDQSFCQHFFQISDRDALRALLPFRSKTSVSSSQGQGNGRTKLSKNCCTCVLRDLVWSLPCWWSQEFETFLQQFRPEIILLQSGDSPFRFSIARKIAAKFQAKLVLFTTENYVLKEYIYQGADKSRFWHTILKHRLEKQYALAMQEMDFCLYNTEQLEQDYQQRYPHAHKSAVFYTGSLLADQELTPCQPADTLEFIYCGNLGVGRIEPLLHFAQVLTEIAPQATLVIYGRFVSKQEETLLCAQHNVEYRGFVAYEEVLPVLQRAFMLIHCENSDRVRNLYTAFSTKIADSLAVGIPFLVYASRDFPFVQYLERNHCAHIAADASELKIVLQKCFADPKYRYAYVEQARKIAQQNHSIQKNSLALSAILASL